MKIVVTGASGQLGRLVTEQLLGRLSAEEVILVTRNPDALADFAGLGASVRYGDFDEPASLDGAFSDGERVLLISTDAIGRRVEQHRAALECADRAGIEHVVYTSSTNPVVGHPVGLAVDENRETEELLHGGGIAFTVLRNAAYAELQVVIGTLGVTYGKLVTNAGNGRVAPSAYPPPVDPQAEFIKRELDPEDERIDVGVAIVGGGTAGLATANRLLQLLAERRLELEPNLLTHRITARPNRGSNRRHQVLWPGPIT